MKKLTCSLLLALITACGSMQPDYLAGVAPAELNQFLQKTDIFLVDVHTPEQSHIKGTDLVVPYNEIAKHQDKFPSDKNTPIYLYCRSGRMVTTAAKTLHELGYQRLINLDGGTEAWKAAGFALQ